MTKPLITIHNVETGEIQTREMNTQEFAQYQADQELEATKAAAEAAKAADKAALLAKLGITEDEAKLLLS
jgi:hypothetical protein